MKKSELKQLLRTIIAEVIAAKSARLTETKAYSGYKKPSEKTEHTEKIADSKTLTPTTNPMEKKEGKKLPVKDNKSNTETSHMAPKKSTPVPPSTEKEESKSRPVGGHAAIKEEIVSMIREVLQTEMAKKPLSFDGKTLTGSISTSLRKQDAKSPTGWSLNSAYKLKDGTVVPLGTPVDAPAMTGKKYVSKGMTGMGRPKAASVAAATTDDEATPSALEVSAEIEGQTTPLEFDFLNGTWPQAKKFIEAEVMANLGDHAVDPQVKIGQEVYDAIEAAKENDLDGKLNASNNKLVLYFDPSTKQLRVKK